MDTVESYAVTGEFEYNKEFFSAGDNTLSYFPARLILNCLFFLAQNKPYKLKSIRSVRFHILYSAKKLPTK